MWLDYLRTHAVGEPGGELSAETALPEVTEGTLPEEAALPEAAGQTVEENSGQPVPTVEG